MVDLNNLALNNSLSYGFAFFENIEDKKTIKSNKLKGIACIYNKNKTKVFSFSDVKDLPSNVTFWTNLEKHHVWKYSKYDNLKDKNYFAIDFKSILQNYVDLTDPNLSVEEKRNITVKELATIFSYVLFETENLCQKFFEKQEENNVSFDVLLKKSEKLQEILYYCFLQKKYSLKTPNNIRSVFKDTYKDKISFSIKDFQEYKTFNFILEPNQYAKNLFSNLKIPFGNWENVTSLVLGSENQFVGNLNKQKEILKKISEDKNLLIGVIETKITNNLFGNVAYDKQNKINENALYLGDRGGLLNNTVYDGMWLTYEEFEKHSRYTEFKIEKVLANNKSNQLYPIFLNQMYLENESVKNNYLRFVSLTQQIILKSFLEGIKNKSYEVLTRKENDYTEIMVWLLAKDREICFNHALNLSKLNYEIVSYGNGEITVYISDKSVVNKKETILYLINNGFIVSTMLIDKNNQNNVIFEEIQQEHKDDIEEINLFLKNKDNNIYLLSLIKQEITFSQLENKLKQIKQKNINQDESLFNTYNNEEIKKLESFLTGYKNFIEKFKGQINIIDYFIRLLFVQSKKIKPTVFYYNYLNKFVYLFEKTNQDLKEISETFNALNITPEMVNKNPYVECFVSLSSLISESINKN